MRRWLAVPVVCLLALTAACGDGGTAAKAKASASATTDGAAASPTDRQAAGAGSPSGSVKHTTVTFDPRGEAAGLHCGLPTAAPPPTQPGQVTPSTAFPEPVNDFPLKVTLSPTRGDPRSKLKVSVLAGRPRPLIVLFATWTDGKDHNVRQAEFGDPTGRATFDVTVPAGLPPGQANIVVSANFQVADQTETALVSEHFIVTGPGCP